MVRSTVVLLLEAKCAGRINHYCVSLVVFIYCRLHLERERTMACSPCEPLKYNEGNVFGIAEEALNVAIGLVA